MNPDNHVSCEAEPIRTPGAIQPHGALLVLRDDEELTVECASENCAAFIGIPAAEVIGKSFARLLGVTALAEFRIARAEKRSCQLSCPANGGLLDCQCFVARDGRLIVDIERAGATVTAFHTMIHQVQHGMAAIRALPDVAAISQGAAYLVRSLTGFDRVMVYRFDADWNGVVLAESCNESAESYLGLQFPASDIPRQARELYLTSKVRQIPDADYRPASLVSSSAPSDIDLGLSALRSVSPVHIEYLKNMGVRATLVGSLIIGGRLWGLLACHQLFAPKYLPRFEREIFAWLCEDLSSQLVAAISQQKLDEKKRRAEMRQRLLMAMYINGFAGMMAAPVCGDLLSIVNADGFALVTDSGIQVIGQTPPVARIVALQGMWRDKAADPTLFHSHALGTDLGFEAGDNGITGALFLSLHHRQDVTMIWFRTERDRAILWGGDPSNPHEVDAEQRISPRHSFAAFRQVICGQSLPWTADDLETATNLGEFIEIEVQRRYKNLFDRSETIYRSVVNAMAEGVVVQNVAGEIITCNPRAEQILGLDAAQMMGRTSVDPRWRAIHEDGQPFPGREHPGMVTLRTGKPSRNVIMGILKPDGSQSWISINAEPLLREGEPAPLGVVTTFLDITERKRLESEDLAARIIATQEHERARLSHDLHDEVGQSLTALKINLARAKHSCANAVAVGCFDQAQAITERLMGEVRSLAHQLRPSELDGLGLLASLRSHIDKVIRPLGLQVTLDENVGDRRFPPDVELSCFRVIQEALTNCIRHAHAALVEVSIKRDGGHLTIVIHDNGIGFDASQRLSAAVGTHSLGLIGMRERVAAIGGQLQIISGQGLGTKILFNCPLEDTPS